jgi:hypothetical protein
MDGWIFSPQRAKICAFNGNASAMAADAASPKFRATNENSGRYPY